MSIDLDIRVYGAGDLFTGRAGATLTRSAHEGEIDVAQDALHKIHARLGVVLRHPTGRYRSTLHVVRSADPYVDGEGTVYGRWLEGVGSRNDETRFKGYRTFRLVAQDVERASGDIMEDRLERWARTA